MKPPRLLLCVALGALAAPAAGAGGWGGSRLWNDGRAEVAVYDSERIVYGTKRVFREHLLTVREELRLDTLVKADQPKGQPTVSVLKLNQVQQFDTDNYPYRYLTSVFVRQDDVARLMKMTVGSQEWCGNTFKILTASGAGQAMFEAFSYFDGEAHARAELPVGENDYFEDQLPLSFRALPFKPGYSASIRLWNWQTTNRGDVPTAIEATVEVTAEEVIRTRAGSIPSWKVTVARPDGLDVYWFEKAFPNILVKMEMMDGRKRLLHGRARWSYWDRRLPEPAVLR